MFPDHRSTVSPARRAAALEAQCRLKMASSAHAYVRGSSAQFYRWLEEHGTRAVPKGPAVWICGDCHAGNLGPLAARDGNVHVQIRDLDQTVMRRATARTWKHLARERLRDVKPRIPRGERFWPLMKAETTAVDEMFEDESVRNLVTSLKSRPDDARIDVLDAAYWMKGCSSLGRLRYAVLLKVRARKRRDDEYCLVDIKEATLRELMPQDLKVKIDRLSREEAVNSARYLAEDVGKAHARQMDSATRRELAASFSRREAARLNAPSWLWSSVVELASAHEAAYLEHCRHYALGPGQ